MKAEAAIAALRTLKDARGLNHPQAAELWGLGSERTVQDWMLRQRIPREGSAAHTLILLVLDDPDGVAKRVRRVKG